MTLFVQMADRVKPVSLLNPDVSASADSLPFTKDDLEASSTEKLFGGLMFEHPKENNSTAEYVPPDSNGPRATDLNREEAVNNNNNTEDVQVVADRDYMNAIEDSNNIDTESKSSDHQDTEGKVVGKVSAVSSILTNQEICSDQQNSISNSYSMTVDSHLDLQKQYVKKIKLFSGSEDIAEHLRHGDHSSEESSDQPISPAGDFSPCFPEKSKDHSSCSMTFSQVTVSFKNYVILYATRDIMTYPIQCTEESLKGQMPTPEKLFPCAAWVKDIQEESTNIIIGAEMALTTYKAIELQHSAEKKFKRPIKALNICNYMKSGSKPTTGLADLYYLDGLLSKDTLVKSFRAHFGERDTVELEDLEMDIT